MRSSRADERAWVVAVEWSEMGFAIERLDPGVRQANLKYDSH
jgi:hypothetical protein